VKQLVWFEGVDDDETFGVHTLDTAEGTFVEPGSMALVSI
jgi:hypothetical protein